MKAFIDIEKFNALHTSITFPVFGYGAYGEEETGDTILVAGYGEPLFELENFTSILNMHGEPLLAFSNGTFIYMTCAQLNTLVFKATA